ncbi:hypothetical protein CEXT_431861 [Caerostris extrusa]|uniref:Uncharacterized protein n=1 Tax=Caerostris extrusa TaxID=172846 RepID=A0AAV4TF49_CAEEX|nr:hypothetical protein CEXT_431861 [Caerostris extrusa]
MSTSFGGSNSIWRHMRSSLQMIYSARGGNCGRLIAPHQSYLCQFVRPEEDVSALTSSEIFSEFLPDSELRIPEPNESDPLDRSTCPRLSAGQTLFGDTCDNLSNDLFRTRWKLWTVDCSSSIISVVVAWEGVEESFYVEETSVQSGDGWKEAPVTNGCPNCTGWTQLTRLDGDLFHPFWLPKTFPK